MNKDLTTAQKDYAVFLPAISSFYSTYIGKQQSDPNYVPADRMPQGIPDMEMLNFLNPKKGLFHYKWSLYSAGHANLDVTKEVPKEDMTRKRGGHTLLLADSGGFQIAKGVWAADWKNMDKDAQKYRERVLKWLCAYSDYAMTLDIPTWTCTNETSREKTNIRSYNDAVVATKHNNEYFIKNRTGDTKFLNVMQGSSHKDAEAWYEEMKQYCDPKQYDNHFNGWGMGGLNMAEPELALKRIVTIIHDGLLTEGIHDWMHFLGTSKLEWAVFLTDIQRAVRRTHNKNFTISFDCASPFLATANGQIYHHTRINSTDRWSYSMDPTADDKKYANDTRLFRDAVLQDKIHDVFEDSPISEKLMIKDICVYAPGDKNKIGKEGKTSWDSFSYTLMMAHNVWQHINAVQEANRQYDAGVYPPLHKVNVLKLRFRDIINQVFDEPDYEKRLQIIEDNKGVWRSIPGARGMGGKNPTTTNEVTSNPDMFANPEVFNAVIATKHVKVKPKKAEVVMHPSLFEGE